jgi:hypothetical protein
MSAFISIPVRSITLDPDNREQVRALIRRADAKFKLSAKAWERGQNSGCSRIMNSADIRSGRLGDEGAALLAPLGIECSWPGLYPAFEVRGLTEYTTESAVLTALGKPRNWLNF